MRDVCSLIWLALIGLFRSRASLQAEILTLRHQLNVLRRKSPQRLIFSSIDRLVFAGLYRLAPGVLDALKIVRPETRDLVWINVTANPTAEWVARQITEAFPWDEAPHYLIRDRDRQCCHAPIALHGHPGQAYLTGLALAEWLCRTADRIDPA
jgi:hypothetical protein